MVGTELSEPGADPGGIGTLGAGSDAEAVAMWIHARGGRSVNTNRVYNRVGTRLLVWLKERGLSLGSMTVADAQAHMDALRRPRAEWLIPQDQHGGVRIDPARPVKQSLKAPMSDKGISYSRTVLNQLFNYLRDAGYVRRNVFALTQIPPVVNVDVADTVLTPQARAYLWEWLVEHDGGRNDAERFAAARDRWVFALLYFTGLRPAEAVGGLMRHFALAGDGWELRVVGKGAKLRRTTVNAPLSSELLRFRGALGLVGWPTPSDNTPLVPSLRRGVDGTRLPIGVRMLHKLVERFGAAAARECGDEQIAVQLRQLSPYWCRHTGGTDRLRAGARLETVQQEYGHADPKTTLIYARISDKARREDAERFGQATKREDEA